MLAFSLCILVSADRLLSSLFGFPISLENCYSLIFSGHGLVAEKSLDGISHASFTESGAALEVVVRRP